MCRLHSTVVAKCGIRAATALVKRAARSWQAAVDDGGTKDGACVRECFLSPPIYGSPLSIANACRFLRKLGPKWKTKAIISRMQ